MYRNSVGALEYFYNGSYELHKPCWPMGRNLWFLLFPSLPLRSDIFVETAPLNKYAKVSVGATEFDD